MHFAGLESIGLMDDLLQSFDIGQLNSEQNLPGVNMSLNPIFSFLANEADDTFDVESLPNRFKSAIDSVYDDYEAYIQVIKLVDSAILTGVVGAMDQDICSLKSSLEEKDNQVIRLESRIKRMTEDSLETKEKFNKQLGEKDACILNLEKQMSKLCQDMVQLALNLNEESKKSVFLEKKVKDIQIADNLKSKQINAMREEMGKLKEERDFSLEQATREFRIRELRLDEKMEHLVLDNERQISSLRRENAQHKTTIEALVALESNLREQIRKISEDHLISLELVEKLEKEKQCLLKETVSLARLKDNELDTEINEIVQDQLDALEKDTEVLNDMLEDEVNDMGRQIRTLRHEVTVLENTIEEQKWMDELELSIIMDVYHGLLTDVTSISEVSGKIDSNQYIISDLADSNEVLEEVMTEQAANSIFEQNAQDSGGLCCENVVDEKRRLEIESSILMACLEGYSSDTSAAMEKLKTSLGEVKDKLASMQEELEISKFLEQEAHQEIDNLKSHLNTSSETRSRLMGSLHGNNQEENVQEMVAETVEQQPQSTEDLFKEEMQKFDIKEEMHKFDIDADVEDAIVAQDIETSIYLAYMEGLSADLTCSISDQNQLSALKDTKLGFVLSEVKSLRGILEAWRRLGTTHHISEYKPQPHDNVVDGFELADLLVDEVSELYKCISSWDPSEGNMLTSNLRESLLERCWQHQIEMEILVEIFLSKFKEVASANFQVYNTKLMQFKSPSKHMSSEVDDVLSTDGNGLDNVAGDNFANEGVMDDELLPEEETESLIVQLRTEISELRRERDQIIGEKTEEVYKMKREFYKELDRLRHEGNEQAIRLVEKINERSSEKGVVASHVECYSKGLSLQSNMQSGTQTRQDHGCYDNVEISELEGKNGRLVAYFSEVLKRKEHDMTLVLEEKEDMRKHKIKLEVSVQDLRNDIKALIEQKEELLFQLDEERCHRFSMGAEVEKLICDNHNLKEELDYVQKQLQEERDSKFDMEVDLQELASQVDHLKGKVEVEENIKLRLENDVQKLEEKIANLNSAVSSSNSKLEESTQCVFRMELDLKRYRDETSTLMEALVATQKNLESEQNKRIMKEYNEDNLEQGLCEAQKIVESGLATQIEQFEMFAKTVDATITGMSRRVQDVGICVASMRGNAKRALLKQAEYKKNLRKNIRNLQKAEVEVDLLGDEVDYLLSLLEKVFAALNHYAPILKHYPGLLELSRLIKQELILRVDCGN